MLIVETIRKIRCAYHRDKRSIRQIARDFHLFRNTVKKVIRGDATEFVYDRQAQPLPKLAPYEESLQESLTADSTKPLKERRTAVVLFEELQRQGFDGGYDSVRRYVQKWRKREEGRKIEAYIPITNALGESINAKVEKIKRMACGFRNRSHYRTAIYFHCGGLDLFPNPPTEQTLRFRAG